MILNFIVQDIKMKIKKSKGIFYIDGQPIFSVEDDKVKDKVCSIAKDGRRSRLRDRIVTITSSELTIVDGGVEFLASYIETPMQELIESIKNTIKKTDPEVLSYGRTKTHTKKTIGKLLNLSIGRVADISMEIFEEYSWK